MSAILTKANSFFEQDIPSAHLRKKLDMLESARAAADARAADAERQLEAVCTELLRGRSELELVAGQRDGLASALAEWGEWRGNLVHRLAQAVEAQRRWLGVVDPALLQAIGTQHRATFHKEVAQSPQPPVRGANRDSVDENAFSLLERMEAMSSAGEMVCGGSGKSAIACGTLKGIVSIH
jgi:hypothetical protein